MTARIVPGGNCATGYQLSGVNAKRNHKQNHRGSNRKLLHILVAVPTGICSDLASKHGVDEHKISSSQDHPEAPPCNANVERIGSGKGPCDGDIAGRVRRGGQKSGVETDCCTDHHHGQVDDGGQEGLLVSSMTREEEQSE
jgi:hypothetical protein